ncbi:phosphonate transport system ATP-binding protein [Nocardioides luteus]|uniref:Phosphonates import ATP-binding protein PhnC n=1 Tax=Nocardioides luteus TaxID=1844 RepID=A0ABQ5SSP4_9ACTN|nr:phosphonate ABC transporter ATP-binding protein [Nocardioides luteus]MDR7309929.1 phosphonate transport system ATP-binding protein [Nocardioides luteus]GGR59536.1 phosphonates import ATP-binding protein PhnC [Nocardioides luteus]GLJ67162.1 phosphonates import ATP-binding protein PhnC [Nocardioides luteus]
MSGSAPGGGNSIVFDGVSVVYPNGTRGLDQVSLTIPAGEFVVVVGLSGAGKSTLIRTINGLVPVTAGTLSVGDTDVASARGRRLRRLRAEIGMIFQGFNLVSRRSVMGNVLTGRLHDQPWFRSLLGIDTKEDKEIAFQALERVGIVEKAWVRASELSGGQQQRVAIARALAQQPSVVLADEPVASLDPPTANLVMRDLQRINRDLGITTVVNLHFLDLARRYADRIIGMRAGEVVFDGPAAEADDAVFEKIYGRSLTAEDVTA